MFSEYVESTGSTKSGGGSEEPELFHPEPTEEDFNRGFITRYFAQRRNKEQQITEISESQFRTHRLDFRGLNNRLYEVFSLDWKISGPEEDIYKGSVPVANGVKTTNENLLELEEEDHPGISNYLDDPLEFWEQRIR